MRHRAGARSRTSSKSGDPATAAKSSNSTIPCRSYVKPSTGSADVVLDSAEVAMVAGIRVLHIIQNLHYGGMEKLLADIVQNLDKARFDTHVLALTYLGRYAREMEGH